VQTLQPNPSIERTPYGTLRVPPVAAHVERCASAPAFACPPPGGLSLGVGAAHGCRPALGVASSFFGPSRSMSSPGAARRASSAYSAAGSVCARHQGASRVPSNTAAQCSAVRSAKSSARSLTALHLCSASARRSFTVSRMRACGASNPGSHNTSIERTNNGGQGSAAWRASLAPLFAAHVER
jgi:hypothetical protein